MDREFDEYKREYSFENINSLTLILTNNSNG